LLTVSFAFASVILTVASAEPDGDREAWRGADACICARKIRTGGTRENHRADASPARSSNHPHENREGSFLQMSPYSRVAGANSSSLKHADDTQLVSAAKSGDHYAFVELFHRHSAKILRTTLRVTGNHHDAEDAMQDAFLNAYAHIAKFDGRAQFGSWLIRIAINSSLIILRKRRIRPETSIDSSSDIDSSYVWNLIDSSADIETHYFIYERTVRLRKAIGRLPPKLRSVVEIQQARDGSLKETAEVANLSVAAAKSRLLRARQALRRTLV
jgi:RNA polymerase sigma factor (sigma-70 family)